ncbi:MAG TPA: MFS transporter [Dermatophilaceae bacterium]|nr:MFS transporter [Dermatophilaceae bacterium]
MSYAASPAPGAAAAPSAGQMGRAERWLFAAGDLFGGGASATLAVFYLFYLTDIVGIPPGLAGTTIVVSKVWDAINHPIMGVITDRTRSRWGRRRPWIFGGALLLPPAMAALWAPIGDWSSTTAKVWFVIIAHLLWTTVASVVLVPYGSLSTEVTTDPDERSRVNVLRLGFATFSTAGCTLVMNILVKAYMDGVLSVGQVYVALFAGFGTFFSVPLLLAARFSHERAPVSEHVDHLDWRVLLSPFQVRSFRRLLVLYICPAITIDLVTSVAIYFVQYVVRADIRLFMGTFALASIGMVPLLLRLVSRLDKAVVYRSAIPASVVAMVVVAFYSAAWPHWPIYLLCAVAAVGIAAPLICVWVMFPDVVDDGELRQGERNAGSFAGIFVLVRTAASAVATFVVGWVLELSGYRQPEHGRPRIGTAVLEQPESAILGIRLVVAISVVVLMAIAWWGSRHYPLTRARMLQIDGELDVARAARHTVSAEGAHTPVAFPPTEREHPTQPD